MYTRVITGTTTLPLTAKVVFKWILADVLLELLDQLSFLKKMLNSGVHTSTWELLLNQLLSLHLVRIDFPDVAMIYCYHYSKYVTYVCYT